MKINLEKCRRDNLETVNGPREISCIIQLEYKPWVGGNWDREQPQHGLESTRKTPFTVPTSKFCRQKKGTGDMKTSYKAHWEWIHLLLWNTCVSIFQIISLTQSWLLPPVSKCFLYFKLRGSQCQRERHFTGASVSIALIKFRSSLLFSVIAGQIALRESC